MRLPNSVGLTRRVPDSKIRTKIKYMNELTILLTGVSPVLLEDTLRAYLRSDERISVEYLLSDSLITSLTGDSQLLIEHLLETVCDVRTTLDESLQVTCNLVDTLCAKLQSNGDPSIEYLLSSNAVSVFSLSESLSVSHNLTDDLISLATFEAEPSFSFLLQDDLKSTFSLTESLESRVDLDTTVITALDTTDILSVLFNLHETLLAELNSADQLQVTHNLETACKSALTADERLSVDYLLHDDLVTTLIDNSQLQVTTNLQDTNVGTFSLDEMLQVSYNLETSETTEFSINETLDYYIALRDVLTITMSCTETLSVPLFEDETYALLSRLSIQPSFRIRDAMNNYIKGLKDAGIWPLLDLLYMTAASNSMDACLNWVKNNFNGTIVGNPTFIVNKGVMGDAKGYIDTNMQPSLTTNLFKQNSSFMALRTLNSFADSIVDFGNGNTFINSRKTLLGLSYAEMGTSALVELILSPSSGIGSFSWSRKNALEAGVFLNSTKSASLNLVSLPPAQGTFKVCGYGIQSSSKTLISNVAAGSYLTDAQVLEYTRLTDVYLGVVGAL